MSQTLREQRAIKVAIGSRYNGPVLDRPCLRQLPRGWVLEETKPVKKVPLSPEFWVGVAVAFGWVFAIVQTVMGAVK